MLKPGNFIMTRLISITWSVCSSKPARMLSTNHFFGKWQGINDKKNHLFPNSIFIVFHSLDQLTVNEPGDRAKIWVSLHLQVVIGVLAIAIMPASPAGTIWPEGSDTPVMLLPGGN